ncbi:hypothetical protein AMTRI_Chr09g39630 [Amborella trichopoda]
MAFIPDVLEIPHMLLTESSLEEEDLDPKDDHAGKMMADMRLKFKGEVKIVEEVIARSHHSGGLIFDWKLRTSSQYSLSTVFLLVSQGLQGEVKTFDRDDCAALERTGPRRH